MIVKDQYGKKVNATEFTVEINRTCCGVRISPEVILKGKYSYLNTMLKTKQVETTLKKLPYNDKNVDILLEMKEKYEEECRTISSQMHKELGDCSAGTQLGKEQEWLVEHSYKFFERDELHFPKTGEEAMNWVLKGKLPGQEELDLEQ